MSTISQSYSSQVYARIQDTPTFSAFSGDKENAEKGLSSESSQTKQSVEDSISISTEGKELSRQATSETGDEQANQKPPSSSANEQDLGAEELKMLTELKARDTEVRTHEQAHLSVAGQYATGGASFSYQTGPDGKRYAVGGEVPIDTSKEKTPEATIQKMRTVQRAALAPASPSAADRSIAAQASAKEAQAMKEMKAETQKESVESTSESRQKHASSTAEQESEPTSEEDTEQNPTSSKISDYSRHTMTSAYSAMAALAA